LGENSNSLNHIYVSERASFKLVYNQKDLVRLKECNSDLRILYIFEQITTDQIKIGPTETTSFKFG